MNDSPESPNLVFWTLRIGVAMEFIGHGMLGFGHPPSWAAYFGVVGIGPERAYALMPWIGIGDIVMGIAVLFYPCRAMVWYMALWGLWTAMLRPMAGESVWEAVERAGNYGVPFALFLLTTGGGFKAWLGSRLTEPEEGLEHIEFQWVLELTTILLLVGHGMLGLHVHKALYATQYAAIGFQGRFVESFVGVLECLLAGVVLFRPTTAVLVGVLLWKLASEALNPIAGAPIWVFIEHGGSYAAPLALALLTRFRDERIVREGDAVA